ncbi:MAG: LysR family transcriptional regulator [Negativicutes bacterium]|nr:LysR family transcriptional regulator [Negativicutes bacterium]
MTIRHLKIFIVVADLKNMTAASKTLFISQPTVSQAITDLENHYGIKLFERLNKRLYLTEKGSQLLSYARHVTSLMEEMEQVIKNSEKSGSMTIGATLTIGEALLPDLISSFNKEYPRLKVKAIIKNTLDIEELIIKNFVELAIVEGTVHSPDIVFEPFKNDELVLVCGMGHPLYGVKILLPKALADINFIVREKGSGTRELFDNTMSANEINWQPSWECNGSDILKSAALRGLGVAVISKRLVTQELKNKSLHALRIEGITLRRQFSIIYHKNKYMTESMKAFIALCKKLQ